MLRFGTEHCLLSPSQAITHYKSCFKALTDTIDEVKHYSLQNPKFTSIARKMMDSWQSSLDGKTLKELPDEIIRNWRSDKKD